MSGGDVVSVVRVHVFLAQGTAEPKIRLTPKLSSYSSESSSNVIASLGMIADLSPSISSSIADQ